MGTSELNEELNVEEIQSEEEEQDTVESDAMIKVISLPQHYATKLNFSFYVNFLGPVTSESKTKQNASSLKFFTFSSIKKKKFIFIGFFFLLECWSTVRHLCTALMNVTKVLGMSLQTAPANFPASIAKPGNCHNVAVSVFHCTSKCDA